MAHPIQIILTRQLAAYLSVPLFLVDPKGNLLFYNEPAEAILGRRFDETGAMPLEEWWSAFTRSDDEGQPIQLEDHPLMITLAEKRPTSKRYHTRVLDGVVRHIEVTSIPITGLQGDILGAVALFWEISE
jgi:PAS domain S-box-containing protein